MVNKKQKTTSEFDLSSWLKLMRIEHSVIAAIGALVGRALVGMPSVADLPLVVLAPFLVTAGAFALNDYHGYETDKENKRFDRPIVAGAITRKQAAAAAYSLILLGIISAIPAGTGAFALALLLSVFAIAYDPILKKLPLIGNTYIAFTMAAPFVYGYLTLSSIKLLSTSSPVALLALIAFLSGIGRELLNTLRDVEGDKKIGARTLPMLLGAKKTTWLASAFILLAIAASLVPFATRTAGLPYLVLIGVADLLFLVVIYQANKQPGNVQVLRKCRNLSLGAMLVGVLAFLSLAL